MRWAPWVAAVDLDKNPLESVVADWMKENESRWSAWLP